MADPIIYEPTGLAINPSWNLTGNFGNQSSGVLFRPIPNVVLSTKGKGLFPATHNAVRGTIDMWITMDAASGSVKMLAQTCNAENVFFGDSMRLTLVPGNYVQVEMIAQGNLIGLVNDTTAFAAGSKVHVVFTWDSAHVVAGMPNHAKLIVNGVEGSWAMLPSFPWRTNPTTLVQVGYGTGYDPFLGSVDVLQLGESV